MKKKLLTMMIVGVMGAAMLAGCGGNSGSDSTAQDTAGSTEAAAGSTEAAAEDAGGSGSKKLVMAWWGNQVRNERTQQALDKYHELNPDVEVEGQFNQWNDYWQKLATDSAGDALPDVIQMDYAYVSQYANSGVLADLTPYFESKAIDISDVADSVVKAGQVGEGVYALSTGSNACVIGYRKDIADEAGVTVPVSPTWEELEEISKTVRV